ncbi:nitrate reductase cytochrome c-type subunit [Archangium violaceum]|uniref:nitrate reductase cytochrome c-type subunit n=1 Tax=Archangium violaceum TaxID=83451 RepID=UPI0019511851|nr:nitrate reductase cytochrome c-type subunit [Archangium violaceum]QRO00538.1 nitrate reductase cytochrome c-type subunit [Archangium violaceum]
MSAAGEQSGGLGARWLQVGAAVAVALAATGYFAGLRAPEMPERPAASDPHAQRAERAPSYSELREQRRGDNARMYEGAIASLAEADFPVKPLPVATPEMRAEAVAQRKTHRAYDGAPPTIPHEIDQREVPGCLACHGEGMKLGTRVAPKISHPPYQSCTQCHVVGESPRPLAQYKDVPGNGFVGLVSGEKGARAWQGAPPTLPHPTLMRTDCTSCHGPRGLPGLRTSHPERQNCQQCHGSSALLDQRLPEDSGAGAPGQPPGGVAMEARP